MSIIMQRKMIHSNSAGASFFVVGQQIMPHLKLFSRFLL